MFFIYVTQVQFEKDNMPGLDNGRCDTVDARDILRTVQERNFPSPFQKTQKIAG